MTHSNLEARNVCSKRAPPTIATAAAAARSSDDDDDDCAVPPQSPFVAAWPTYSRRAAFERRKQSVRRRGRAPAIASELGVASDAFASATGGGSSRAIARRRHATSYIRNSETHVRRSRHISSATYTTKGVDFCRVITESATCRLAQNCDFACSRNRFTKFTYSVHSFPHNVH